MSDSEGKLITFSGCLFATVIWIAWQAGSGVPGVRGEKAPVPTWGAAGRSREGWGGHSVTLSQCGGAAASS